MLVPMPMRNEEMVNLLAQVAGRSGGAGVPERNVSILSLAAATYGSRPSDEATVPTGFDPAACQLFEAIVEGAYLVACADGVFDDEERKTFETVVTTACGGSVGPRAISALVLDLKDQLQEDGLEKRIEALCKHLVRPDHAREVLRIASLIALVSDNVSDVERAMLMRIATASGMVQSDVDSAIEDARVALLPVPS